MLTADERRRIDACVAAFEAGTGAQLVAAIVDKSDDYPEIPWKAFAFGVSFATLAFLLVDLLRPDWPGTSRGLVFSTLTLGAGAALALITIRSRTVARWFLNRTRAEAETLQHAQVLFLRHELFRTGRRNALLLAVSRFERRIVLLPDTDLAAKLDPGALQRIVDAVSRSLASGRIADAVCTGIDAARDLLVANGIVAGAGRTNELADTILEEAGDGRG